jgi:hypothetical protein
VLLQVAVLLLVLALLPCWFAAECGLHHFGQRWRRGESREVGDDDQVAVTELSNLYKIKYDCPR